MQCRCVCKQHAVWCSEFYCVIQELKISPQDVATSMQFSVLTDRTHGGASLNDGQVELMVGMV